MATKIAVPRKASTSPFETTLNSVTLSTHRRPPQLRSLKRLLQKCKQLVIHLLDSSATTGQVLG